MSTPPALTKSFGSRPKLPEFDCWLEYGSREALPALRPVDFETVIDAIIIHRLAMRLLAWTTSPL